jgi:hypothetical protein
LKILFWINKKNKTIPLLISNILKEMSNRRITRSMTRAANQSPLIDLTQPKTDPKPVVRKPKLAPKPAVKFVSPKVYIEPGVEFLTYEECKNRGLTNDIFDKYGTKVLGLFVYRNQETVHPIYRTNLTPEQRNNPDLFAVAPRGFLWEEEPSGTSYYSWDEYYKLVNKNPYI